MVDAAFQDGPNVSLAGKKVLVMGLGRFGGGVGVARWLVREGAVVTVNDAATAEDLSESIRALDGLPITFTLGGHRLEDFVAADLLVLNPAVDKEKSEVVKAALARGIPYTTEMNLFVQRCPGRTIGITGSVGKSTTTMLIYEALLAGSQGTDTQVFLGGNIGRSLLLDLPKIQRKDVVLLELSSFMLEETPRVRAGGRQGWSPHIAVITNVFANHLDRHNTMEGYAAAKQNILKFQTKDDVAIVNDDHEAVRNWAALAHGRVVGYTTRGVPSLPLVLPGQHNQSNARAALAVLDALPEYADPSRRSAALAAIENFAGLAHRLALVHTLTIEGHRTLRFYNDSKATSPDASITALRAFAPRTAIFLVGGYDKHIDLAPFEAELSARAAGVIGIGQTGAAIAGHVGPDIRSAYAGTLEAAMPLAREWAQAMPSVNAVVLSPASASWGQFANYEQRGERFAELSQAI
jgi:UDP-N-acetylmuramoylalanine--D-glutamate ligase